VLAVNLLRDYRLRHHFGDRYDFRNNLIDWDYQTTVKPTAGNIHFVQYRHWRNTGLAFEFGDQVYTTPNRTMASYAAGKERGRGSTLRRGFWSDVVVSPYHALGTAASIHGDKSKKLFDIHNRHSGSEQWRHVSRVAFCHDSSMCFCRDDAGCVVSCCVGRSPQWSSPSSTCCRTSTSWRRGCGTRSRKRTRSTVDWGQQVRRQRVTTPRRGIACTCGRVDGATAGDDEKKVAEPAAPGGAASTDAAAASTTAASTAAAGTAGTAAVPEPRAAAASLEEATRRARQIARTLSGLQVSVVSGDFVADVLAKKRFARK
jgi:hypothetical protein